VSPQAAAMAPSVRGAGGVAGRRSIDTSARYRRYRDLGVIGATLWAWRA
jgi:hypothetical protein